MRANRLIRVRKIPAAIAVTALAALTLVGCAPAGSAASADCSRATEASKTLDLVTVTGKPDAAPEVEMFTPLHAKATEFQDLEVGEGNAITDGEQLVVLDISIVNATNGETLVQTPYDGDMSRVFALSRWVQTFPGFADALDCATEGSRVVVALAPGDIEDEAAAGLTLAEDDSAVAVIDVRKVYLPRADGDDQFVEGHGMPTVVRATSGQPGIIVPDATPPSEVVVEVLKKGRGEVVTGDAPVRVHYTGVTWADRKEFDTSWDGEPASLTLDGVVPGFAQALEGQTVGSQVLVVIPPEAGYGDQQQGAIPANSTLVFVIDILGIDAAPAQ